MKRVFLTYLILAVMGGCMSVEPDPIVEYPSAPAQQHFPAQAQAWSYQPQSAIAAAKKTDDKTDNTLVKAAYNEIKPAEDPSPPICLGLLRLTNSKRITFHYELDGKTSDGGANLEIWGTTDLHSWKKYDAVSRTPSALVVEVREEGLYGFTMIDPGKDASAKSQPPAGEPPQVWVTVDLTKPVVHLIDAQMNVRAQTPALIVRWIARDRNFGPQPIAVLYAEHAEGPWRPLTTSVENSGRYEGPLPPHLSNNVYLRVQAADLMGNISLSQTAVVRIPSRAAIDTARASRPAVSILSVDGE